jgi:hypothetical protein
MPAKRSGSGTPAKAKPTRRKTSKNSPAVSEGVHVTIRIDDKKRARPLATSEVPTLRDREFTDAELFAEVTKLYPKYDLQRIFNEGARTLAKRKIAEAHSTRMLGQRTKPGSADIRLASAFERLNENNAKAKAKGRPTRKVTAWTLSETAKTSWRTAKRWIEENKPVVSVTQPKRRVSKKV